MDKKDSAYWPDKSDPLGRVHGKDKLWSAEKKILAYKFMAWCINCKPHPEMIRAVEKKLDEGCFFLKGEIEKLAQENKSFFDEAN